MSKKELINSKGNVFIQTVGVVKSFNEETGYGFLFTIEEPERDIYFHFTQIITEGKKELTPGDNVEFIYTELAPDKLRAFSVKKIEER